MINNFSFVIEQRKNEYDMIAEVRFPPSIFMPYEGDITFLTPASVYF